MGIKVFHTSGIFPTHDTHPKAVCIELVSYYLTSYYSCFIAHIWTRIQTCVCRGTTVNMFPVETDMFISTTSTSIFFHACPPNVCYNNITLSVKSFFRQATSFPLYKPIFKPLTHARLSSMYQMSVGLKIGQTLPIEMVSLLLQELFQYIMQNQYNATTFSHFCTHTEVSMVSKHCMRQRQYEIRHIHKYSYAHQRDGWYFNINNVVNASNEWELHSFFPLPKGWPTIKAHLSYKCS